MSNRKQLQEIVKQAQKAVREKKYDEALSIFNQVLEQDDSFVPAHEGIATTYFLIGNKEKAIEHFNRVSQLDPVNGKALINLGAVYNSMKQYGEAVKVLRKGLSKERKSSEGYYNLGIAHRNLDQNSMAASAYKESIKLNPGFAEAHQNLGNVYRDMGNYQQAITHYEKALEIKPDFERAHRGLESAREAMQDAKQSVSPFGRLVDQNSLRAKATPTVVKEMTDSERAQDRAAIHEMIVEVESHAVKMIAMLRQKLEPTLLSLSRDIVNAEDSPLTLSKSHSKFETAKRQCDQVRHEFRQKLVELRAHEEMINTPEFDEVEAESE